MGGKIFISVRRNDADAAARAICQRLEQTFGADRLFMDPDVDIKGLDAALELEQTLNDTSVMLVVMGTSWLEQCDDDGERRLDKRADHVRRQIAHALQLGIPVIPLRIDGAPIPRLEDLPGDIAALAHIEGKAVSADSLNADIASLEGEVARHLRPVSAAAPVRRSSSRRLVFPLALLALAIAVPVAWKLLYRDPAPRSPTVAPGQAPKSNAASDERERARLAAVIRAAAAWQDARQRNTFEAYQTYLRSHPLGEHRREAVEAALPLLARRIETMIDRKVIELKLPDGSPSSYIQSSLPQRVMAACIDWSATSWDGVNVRSWGSAESTQASENLDNSAIARCHNARPAGAACTCQIVHRNRKLELAIPPDWRARQLE